jgi:hypothetical protein
MFFLNLTCGRIASPAMWGSLICLLGIVIIPQRCIGADAADFAGQYTDGNLTLVLTPAPGRTGEYTGTIQLGAKQFLITARAEGQKLSGRFASNGSLFDFTGNLKDCSLQFATDTTAYTLKLVGVPTGYQLATKTATGNAVFRVGEGETTSRALLAATLKDLNSCFDTSPSAGDGFVAKDDRFGALDFSATLAKKKVDGIIVASIGGNESAALVAYDSAGGSSKLMQGVLGAVQLTSLSWDEIKFAGDTGSIRLPTGWKVLGVQHGCPALGGPRNQLMGLGQHLSLFTDTFPYADPLEATKMLWTKFGSKFDPPVKLIKVISSELEAKAADGEQSGAVEFIADIGPAGAAIRMGAHVTMLCTAPDGAGNWKCDYSFMAAPEPRYEFERPVMSEIWNSWRINGQSVMAEVNGEMAAETARFNAQRRSQSAQVSKFRSGMNSQAQGVEDFCSLLGGTGMAKDTSTGQLKPLGAGNTVQDLNQKAGADKYQPYHVNGP